MCWTIKGQDKAISSPVVIKAVLRQVACCEVLKKIVAVVSKITNSCVAQAVIVIISVISVKCVQWHKSCENNKELLK